MGKSKINESHKLSVEGVLDIDSTGISISVEDIGDKMLSDLLKQFNGDNVKITVIKSNDLG